MWRPGRATTRPPSAPCSATLRRTAITPRTSPWSGRAAIVADWLEDPDASGTYDAQYEPLAIDGENHVASGWSRYFETPGGDVRDEYWNVYLVRFDDAGQATDFTEWWIQGRELRPARPRGSRRPGARRCRC